MTRARLAALAPKMARLAVFAALVGIGLWFGLGRMVGRHADGALIGLGAGVLELAARTPRPSIGPRVLELNGARLHLETHGAPGSVDDVLATAEADCRPIDRHAAPARRRGGGGAHGFVACATWLTRAEVVALGDAPGALVAGYRYLYAVADGGDTTVVRLWTAGEVDLAGLFPATGDAPGRDSPTVPRPPNARRLLSARELGAPQEVTLYQVDRGRRAALDRWYRAALPSHGWRALAGVPGRSGEVLVADRGGALAALVFADEPDLGSVTILTSL